MTQQDSNFDAKSAFKSKTGVLRLEQDAIGHARRQARRDEDYLFDVTPHDPTGPVDPDPGAGGSAS